MLQLSNHLGIKAHHNEGEDGISGDSRVKFMDCMGKAILGETPLTSSTTGNDPDQELQVSPRHVPDIRPFVQLQGGKTGLTRLGLQKSGVERMM